jgi:hypothetical protein
VTSRRELLKGIAAGTVSLLPYGMLVENIVSGVQLGDTLNHIDDRVSHLEHRTSEVNRLESLSNDLGLVLAGEFRTGNGAEPGNSFSGVRMGYPGFSYNNEIWNLVGVENDVLQFGVRSSDGKLLSAGGAGIIDTEGLSLYDAAMLNILKDSESDDTKIGSYLGYYAHPDYSSEQHRGTQFTHYEEFNGSNLITSNPGFESGNFTGWTAGAGLAVSSSVKRSGSYSASAPDGVSADLTSARYSATAGHLYLVRLYRYLGGILVTVGAVINFYDHASAGSLIESRTLSGPANALNWNRLQDVVIAPAGALSFEIVISFDTTTPGSSALAYVDDVAVYRLNGWSRLVVGYNRITMESPKGIALKRVASAPTEAGDGLVAIYPKTDGMLYVLNDGGVETQLAVGTPYEQKAISSTTETSIYEGTIAASALGDDGMIRVPIPYRIANTTGSNQTIRFRLYYGATTLIDYTTPNIASSANPYEGQAVFQLYNADATGTQRAQLRLDLAGAAAVGSAATTGGTYDVTIGGTSSEDSTAAKTLKLTITLSAVGGTPPSFRSGGAVPQGPYAL